MGMKIIHVKRKWITVEINGERIDIAKNLFTNHLENGDYYKYHGEIISGKGDGTLTCSCCRRSLLLSDTHYDGWKELLTSKFCRHCGATFINILDRSNNQRLEEFSKYTLEHMGLDKYVF